MREDQSVAEMANEVLMRQAKRRSDRSGEPIEVAMEAVLNTEAGQLSELRDGPHGEERVEEAQVGVARERAQERVEDLGKRLGRPLRSPHTVNGTNFLERSSFHTLGLITITPLSVQAKTVPSYGSARPRSGMLGCGGGNSQGGVACRSRVEFPKCTWSRRGMQPSTRATWTVW